MKKLKNIILTFILMFTVVGAVKAEEQYSIDVKIKNNSRVEMTLKGITEADYAEFNSDSKKLFVRFVDEGDSKPPATEPNYQNISMDTYIPIYKDNMEYDADKKTYFANISNLSNDWYIIKGKTKVYTMICETNRCEVSDNPIVITKPELPALSQRYQITFIGNKDNEQNVVANTVSVSHKFPIAGAVEDKFGNHEINVKYGLINDQSLLRKLAKSEDGSLQQLLTYAKNSDGSIITGNDNTFTYKDINKLDVIDGAYYFVYVYYTDPLYRDISDVAVVMGENNNLINRVDWSQYNTTSLWEQFVEKYKTTDFMKEYNDAEESSGISLDIKSSDSTLDTVIDTGILKLVSNLTYNNGVVTYLPLDENVETFETIFNESNLARNAVVALANLKGYDADKLYNWLKDNEGKLSLEEDGIEYTLEDCTIDQGNGVSVTFAKISSFKFYLDGDIKYDENKVSSSVESSKTENPKTGIDLGYKALVAIIIVGGVAYILTRKRSKFPKHN